jgi:hAT family C-terminal dimerisation region
MKYDFSYLEDTPIETTPSEIKRYKDTSLDKEELSELRNGNLLQWWQKNSAQFPNLSILARRFLCIPATSSSSTESSFTAGRVKDKRRPTVSPEHVDDLLLAGRQKA